MCIFYGHKLWFEPAEGEGSNIGVDDPDDGWGGLSALQDDTTLSQGQDWPLLAGDPEEIIADEQLPFTRVKLINDEEEDLLEAVRLGMGYRLSALCQHALISSAERVWVVDIPEQRHITTMLKYVSISSLTRRTLT